jgi:hypothetical protein
VKGYIDVDQWHSVGVKTLTDLLPENHKGDAAEIDKILPWKGVTILPEQPGCPIGHVIFRVEDDDSLTRVQSNYDSSD